jgi:predicted enzyme related to lactoylglutathione lyase
MGAPVAWFEVTGKGATKLQAFYAQMFDWKIDANNPMNYGMVDTAGQGINDGIGPSQEGRPWTGFCVTVPDLQAVLDKASSFGGKTLVPPTQIPDGPTFAFFADPEGNQVGLLKAM